MRGWAILLAILLAGCSGPEAEEQLGTCAVTEGYKDYDGAGSVALTCDPGTGAFTWQIACEGDGEAGAVVSDFEAGEVHVMVRSGDNDLLNVVMAAEEWPGDRAAAATPFNGPATVALTLEWDDIEGDLRGGIGCTQ